MKIAWMINDNKISEKAKLQNWFREKCGNPIVANWLATYRLSPSGNSTEGKWGQEVNNRDMAKKVTLNETKDVLLSWGLTLEEISDIHGDNYV